jgi:peptide-methionine (S)-S-oxide reductase
VVWRHALLEGEVWVVTIRKWVRLAIGVGLVAIAAAMLTNVWPRMQFVSAATESRAVPAPDIDEPAPAPAASETAVLAGGCFWGVQGVFQHVKGVTQAESGYAGGDQQSANYETVSTGDTGHAESVRITYDPAQVTYGQLLRIFFSVVEDPTQLNRQGPDEGTQYRSAIFAQDDTQKRVAQAYIAQLNRDAVFPSPIVTTASPKAEFFPAEQYHQDFMNSNPTYPYIAVNDMPKLNDLKRLFPELYRDQPVLMSANGR